MITLIGKFVIKNKRIFINPAYFFNVISKKQKLTISSCMLHIVRLYLFYTYDKKYYVLQLMKYYVLQ